METRLRTDIWAGALLRRAMSAGAMATLVRRGDASAGVVLIKINHLDASFDVYDQIRNANGDLVWVKGLKTSPAPEAEVDAYIERCRRMDPDLWVIEIEDRDGRHFLTEPVE
ncbi:MAG: DUF1491 family protein [Alphaproteobacteria bacterium]|nr:MAG: DUF1491 family protein [Alphaproteobacteria bacterium]